MKNPTNNSSENKDLSDGEIFSKITPEIFNLILSLIPEIISVLNFAQSSFWILSQIVNFLFIDKSEYLEMRDFDFSKKMNFENIECGKLKIRRARKSLLIDQELSGCQFIEIIPGKANLKTGEYFSTNYRIDKLYGIIIEIRDLVFKRGILNIKISQKRKKIFREIIKEILFKRHGFRPVPPGAHKKENEKSKGNKSEIKIDRASLNKKRELILQLQEEIYIEGLKLEISEQDYWRRFNSDTLVLERKIAEINLRRIELEHRNGGSPKLKLIGHQPK